MTEAGDRVDVHAPDGWTLGVRTRGADSAGIAVLGHAMLGAGGALHRSPLADALVAGGWRVWTPDFRGRGVSGPTAAAGARWDYDDLVLRDVPTVLCAARRQTRGRVVMLGHSLGGHVGAASVGAGAADVDALVLLAANIWQPRHEPDPIVRGVKGAVMVAFMGSAAGGFVPARRLGLGSVDEAAPYVRDLVRAWRTDRWTSADRRLDHARALGRVGVPVLTVVGAGDRLLARPAGAVGWAAGLPGTEVWVAGHGAHGAVGAPGHADLVLDPAQRALHERIVRWLHRS